MQSEGFSWDVELPERGAVALGGRRPQATLAICSDTHGSERIGVPKPVGRRLVALAESDGAQPTSRAELLYLVRTISLELARSKAEDLLNRRDYSKREMGDKLREAGYLPSVCDEVVRRFSEAGLLDDARFAELFARSKVSCGWGPVKIQRELARRGIDVGELDGWPDEFFDDGGEAQRAYELASRRRLTGKNDYQKLVRFLCGRGFSMGVSVDAAKRVLEEAEEG